MAIKYHCTNVNSNESITQATFTASSDDKTVSGSLTVSIASANDAIYQTAKDYDANLQLVAE
jgi:hypothetical protein